MCDAAEVTEDPARRLAPISAAAYLVLDDARKAARLGEWERVGRAAITWRSSPGAITRLATDTRHDIDQEWDGVGAELEPLGGQGMTSVMTCPVDGCNQRPSVEGVHDFLLAQTSGGTHDSTRHRTSALVFCEEDV